MPKGMEETRGIKPDPKFRGEIAKHIHIELSREFRRRLSNEILNVDGRRREWEHGLMTEDEILDQMGRSVMSGYSIGFRNL